MKYICPICYKLFLTKVNLFKHNKCFFSKEIRIPLIKGYILEKEYNS